MKVMEYEVTLKGEAHLPRHCSACGHDFTADLPVKASEKSLFSPDPARRGARKKLTSAIARKEKWDGFDTFVLCPRCGGLASEAVGRHFPEGYRLGLLTQYKLSLLFGFLAGGLVACLAVAAWVIVLDLSEPRERVGAVLLGLVALGLSVLAVRLLWLPVAGLRCWPDVRRSLAHATGSAMLDLIRKAYRTNNDSLAAGAKWVTVMMGHARQPASPRLPLSDQECHGKENTQESEHSSIEARGDEAAPIQAAQDESGQGVIRNALQAGDGAAAASAPASRLPEPVASEKVQYFKDETWPEYGDGLCSDRKCPCPETGIPRGEGYLFIPPEIVEFRKAFRDAEAARAEMERRFAAVGAAGFFRTGPILVCEQGAVPVQLKMEKAFSQ